MLNYTSDNPPPKSRITNKRVAFPLSSTSGQADGPPLQTIPSVSVLDAQLQRTLDSFNVLLNEIDGNEQLELQQKLEVLKKSWTEGTLPASVQKYVHDISELLCKRDIVKANEIQLKLTMEYGNVCAPWMGLIRGILAVIQAKNK